MRPPLSELRRRNRSAKKRKALHSKLGEIDTGALLRAVWATEAHFGGRSNAASSELHFPAENLDKGIANPFRIHEWELETLVNERFAAEAISDNGWPTNGRTVDFALLASATKALRVLENAEYAPRKRKAVSGNVAATFQRQFEWQESRENTIGLYRNMFIFGSALAQWFEEARGISLEKFVLSLFGAYAFFYDKPSLKFPINVSPELTELGLTSENFEKSMNMVAINFSNSREWVNGRRKQPDATAFRSSLLRQFPILLDSRRNEFFCPLRRLLFERITDGLYYEFQGANDPQSVGELRNQIAQNFEDYCVKLFQFAGFDVLGSSGQRYRFGSKEFEEPDFSLRIDGALVVAECKSKRMTIESKFNLVEFENDLGVQEISKGVSQVWRYVKHARERGVNVGDDVVGLVVTTHEWLLLHKERRDFIFEKAKEIAAARGFFDPTDNLCPVALLSVQHLEWVLARTNEKKFLDFLRRISSPDFASWAPRSVFLEMFPRSGPIRRYGFESELGQYLPWWDELPFDADRVGAG
jgi:hypothetical protein